MQLAVEVEGRGSRIRAEPDGGVLVRDGGDAEPTAAVGVAGQDVLAALDRVQQAFELADEALVRLQVGELPMLDLAEVPFPEPNRMAL